MALKIRLARGGSKKRPYYRVVIAEASAPRDGRFVEKVGTYNPLVAKDHPDRIRLVEDRVRYWLSVGAQPTDRVLRFLEALNIISEKQERNNAQKAQPKAKAQERIKEQADKEAAAKAAAEEAKVAAKAAAEEAKAAAEAAKAAPAEAAQEEAPAAVEESAEAPAEETPTEEPAAS